MKLVGYLRNANLGDAIQTLALMRLVRYNGFVYRNSWHQLQEFETPVLVNGFMVTEPPKVGVNCRFVGVHLSAHRERANLEWLLRSGGKVGCRDPWTLKKVGGSGELCGCVTATLPRYNGLRSGDLVVGNNHYIPKSMSWDEQLRLGNQWLKVYREAQSVVTDRLHIAIPCMAFGTPVKVTRNKSVRFGIFEEMGGKFDEWVEVDLVMWGEKYLRFLEQSLLGLGLQESLTTRSGDE